MAVRSEEMAAEANVTPIKEEPEQLSMFEKQPVHEHRASLAAAGYIEIGDEFKVGARVQISAEGWVKRVSFIKDKDKGILTRQHVIVIEADSTQITEA
jgi:hypothetical protein